MKVSVLIITYNQEGFIAQAVNSALMQEVSFPYEIVIGEDVSTDRTREIVLEFQTKHPDRIRVMLRDAATSERDRARGLGGKTNFVQGLQDCQGEYVALLDGDDYWTSPHKLQKQVDFLDQHPDFAISFHKVECSYKDGRGQPSIFGSPNQKRVLTIEDLVAGNFIHSCSAMFRNKLFDGLPDWFFTTSMGDWALHIINAQHGKIGYIDELMGTYRVHREGFWTSQNPVKQAQDMIRVLDCINSFLNFKYERQLKVTRGNYYQYLSEAYYQGGELLNARSAMRESLRICLTNKSVPNWHLIKRLVKLEVYALLDLLRIKRTSA